MRPKSLRWRLGTAATGLMALALALAGVGLILIFDHVLDRHAAADLDGTARFIAGQVAISGEGVAVLASTPPDPRYAEPYGGLYWQVEVRGKDLRSRSLWDHRLTLPPDLAAGNAPRRLDLVGPDGGRLLAVAMAISVGPRDRGVPVTIAVALDRRDLVRSRDTYLGMLVPSLLGLGLVLALAMGVFVHRALRPFRTLREDLRAVHDGRRTGLPTHFPDEVQPLVDDLNRLLGLHERALERARRQAGDMAHGLKTPLAVLSALSRRVGEERPDLARDIDGQALAMGRQVERSLLRARLAAGRGIAPDACRVLPVVTKLLDSLKRLPDAGSLAWDVDVDPSMTFPGAEGDLMEVMGNLLDNARKWAHRGVRVRCRHTSTQFELVVEDDGPGMSETAMRGIERGQRWDETKPGTGFGLAIASDIAEEVGAAIVLGTSRQGGLMARVIWRTPDPRGAPRGQGRPPGA